MTIVMVLVILVILAVFFVWVLNGMVNSACPHCMEQNGTNEMVLPFLPGVRWLCLNCGKMLKPSELAERDDSLLPAEEQDDDEIRPPRL